MLYEAVSSGNLDEVEDLIGMPECDINMTWFSENLLMCGNKLEIPYNFFIKEFKKVIMCFLLKPYVTRTRKLPNF